jgi:outer membrane protein assembly factor BamB
MGKNSDGQMKVFAFDSAGAPLWATEFFEPDPPMSSIAIGPDGTLYMGAELHDVLRLNPLDGASLSSTLPTSAEVLGTPVIAANGTTYICDENGQLFGYKSDGTVLWNPIQLSPNTISSSIAITADGKLWIIAGDGKLYAVDGTSGAQLLNPPFTISAAALINQSSPIVGADGTVFVGSGSGDFFAVNGFGSASALAPGFWPSFRANKSNSGNVQDNKWTTNGTPSLQITELPNLSVGYTSAEMINNNSQICGNSFGPMFNTGGFRATRWTPNGSSYTSTGLPFLYNGRDFGYFITDGGIIVGSSENSSFQYIPVTWSANNTMTALTLPTGFINYGEVFGGNDGGAAVGYGKNSSSHYHAVKWTSGAPGDMRTLSGDISSLDSYAFGVSSRGITVGESKLTTSGNYHGFVSVGDTINVLTDDWGTILPSPNDYSVAEAINGLGQVVGVSRKSSTVTVAVLKNPGSSSFIQLDLGGTGGIALAINNRGHVVGATASGGGFIYIPGFGTTDLRAMLSSGDQYNWTSLNQPMGINDEGKIVGWGYRNGISDPRSFIITVK